ncbi:NUDIX domain-containing protein [Lysobacter sp. 22409]|uniref:NUDIX domain-containing protein n=1 Tax=Lysobacter sp. 22409 TaxID=3453917 RepID=UPI003F843EA8
MSAGEHGIDLVGALLWRQGRVLLGLRAAHKRLAPNCWDMLGGHVEAGETPEQALWRELQEEAGIGPPVLARPVLATPDQHAAAAASVVAEFACDGLVLRIYRVEAWDGEPEARGDEHQGLQWFEAAQAAALPELADPRLREVLLRLG